MLAKGSKVTVNLTKRLEGYKGCLVQGVVVRVKKKSVVVNVPTVRPQNVQVTLNDVGASRPDKSERRVWKVGDHVEVFDGVAAWWQATILRVKKNRILVKWIHEYDEWQDEAWFAATRLRSPTAAGEMVTTEWVEHDKIPGLLTIKNPRATEDNYDDAARDLCEKKRAYHHNTMFVARDYMRLLEQIHHDDDVNALVLDSVNLGSTHALMDVIPLRQIHVVSKSVLFKVTDSADVPHCTTGELENYLDTHRGGKKFGVAMIDLCSAWTGSTKQLLTKLFAFRMLDNVSVLNVTLAYRNGPKSSKNVAYKHVTDGKHEIMQIGRAHGYDLSHLLELTDGTSQVRYYFFKVVHDDALRTRHHRAIDAWRNASVNTEPSQKKRRK